MNKAWSGLAAAALLAASLRVEARATDLPVVPDVDPARYVGRWHEIGFIPHWFERGCFDTTATYTAADGRIEVLNECRRDNKPHQARAVAWHVGPGRDGKFKVRFFWPFSSHYWVIALDPAYQWAMVGHPSRRYLWILSRKPSLAPAIYDQLIQKATALGYDPLRIQRTPQTERR